MSFAELPLLDVDLHNRRVLALEILAHIQNIFAKKLHCDRHGCFEGKQIEKKVDCIWVRIALDYFCIF